MSLLLPGIMTQTINRKSNVITLQVDLPSHRPVARLEEFNVGLKISKEPELALGATLKIFLKDQAPLKITGSIEGGPIHAGGSLYVSVS